MTEKEITGGGVGRRGRMFASAGVAAVLAAAGLASAGTASAADAGSVTVKLSAPATIASNNTQPGNQSLVVEIINTDKNTAINGSARLEINVPQGLSCNSITLGMATANNGVGTAPNWSGNPTPATSDGGSPVCRFNDASFTQPGNSDDTFSYPITVNGAGVSGSLSSQVTILDTISGSGNTNTTKSNTATSTLASPANGLAPSFNSGAVPVPVVYNDYSYQLRTSAGSSQGSNGQSVTTTYRAFGYVPVADENSGRFSQGTVTAPETTITLRNTNTMHKALNLENGNFFDEVSGKLIYNGATANDSTTLQNTLRTQYDTGVHAWYIIANNTQGGASTATTGDTGGLTHPTPSVNEHDVVSPIFFGGRLFSDVPLASTFSQAIYTLGLNGVLSGFLSGRFDPLAPVDRQAFAHFLAVAFNKTTTGTANSNANAIRTGPCNADSNPSAYSDVSTSNPFCSEINGLSRLGIIRGFKDGTFHPADHIDRQAIAAMVYRFDNIVRTGITNVQQDDPSCTSKPFSDVAVSNPFCGDIAYLKSKGIAKGFSDGSYHPAANSERQAAASFLFQLGDFENQQFVNQPNQPNGGAASSSTSNAPVQQNGMVLAG